MQNEVFFIILSCLITKAGTLVIKPRFNIFEIANVLKIVILSSISFQSLIFHNFKTFSILTIWHSHFFSCSNFSLYKKCIPKIFELSFFRLIYCMPSIYLFIYSLFILDLFSNKRTIC